MTATTTAPRKQKDKSVLDELEALEQKWQEATDTAKALAREHGAATAQARELHAQRQRLISREPGLVDHRSRPLEHIDDNPVEAVDKEIAKLVDLDELTAKSEHARRLAERERQDVELYVTEHYTAIMEALEPESAKRADAVDSAIAGAAAEVERYVAQCQRLMGLAGFIRADTHVDGLDAASALKRNLEGWSLPKPRLDR